MREGAEQPEIAVSGLSVFRSSDHDGYGSLRRLGRKYQGVY